MDDLFSGLAAMAVRVADSSLTPAEREDKEAEKKMLGRKKRPHSRDKAGKGAPKHDNRSKRICPDEDVKSRVKENKDMSLKSRSSSLKEIARRVAADPAKADEPIKEDPGVRKVKERVARMEGMFSKLSVKLAENWGTISTDKYLEPVKNGKKESSTAIAELDKLSDDIKTRGDAMAKALNSAKANDVNDAIAEVWGNDPEDIESRAAILTAVLKAIDISNIPDYIKIPMMHSPGVQAKDDAIIEKLAQPVKGKAKTPTKGDVDKLAQLAAGLVLMRSHPPKIKRGDIKGEDVDKIMEQVNAFADLNKITDAWHQAMSSLKAGDTEGVDVSKGNWGAVVNSIDSFMYKGNPPVDPDKYLRSLLQQFEKEHGEIPEDLKILAKEHEIDFEKASDDEAEKPEVIEDMSGGAHLDELGADDIKQVWSAGRMGDPETDKFVDAVIKVHQSGYEDEQIANFANWMLRDVDGDSEKFIDKFIKFVDTEEFLMYPKSKESKESDFDESNYGTRQWESSGLEKDLTKGNEIFAGDINYILNLRDSGNPELDKLRDAIIKMHDKGLNDQEIADYVNLILRAANAAGDWQGSGNLKEFTKRLVEFVDTHNFDKFTPEDLSEELKESKKPENPGVKTGPQREDPDIKRETKTAPHSMLSISSRSATSYEMGHGRMSKRSAAYHGIVYQGHPTDPVGSEYRSYDKRYFKKEHYDSILKVANEFMQEDWLKYGWDGGSEEAARRAALDLAIHTADSNLYQGKIDAETYDMLLNRFASWEYDPFSETVVPKTQKQQKRSAAAMKSSVQEILRIANDIRSSNPVASVAILKNLRAIVAAQTAAELSKSEMKDVHKKTLEKGESLSGQHPDPDASLADKIDKLDEEERNMLEAKLSDIMKKEEALKEVGITPEDIDALVDNFFKAHTALTQRNLKVLVKIAENSSRLRPILLRLAAKKLKKPAAKKEEKEDKAACSTSKMKKDEKKGMKKPKKTSKKHASITKDDICW